MIKEIINIGLVNDLPPLQRLKVVGYNFLALSTMTITIIYFIIYSMLDSTLVNSTELIVSHFLYILTSFLIILSQYYKKYNLTDYVIHILFPICFIGSCFCFGKGYGAEYYLFITGIGSVFIFDRSKIAVFFTYNIVIFLLLKIFFIYFPEGFYSIDKDFLYFFNVMNSMIIFVIILLIIYITNNKNYAFLSELENIKKEQEQIILDRTKSLETSNEELNRFTYISAHDLREPLRNILSFSQLLERNVLKGENKNNKVYLEFIKKNTKKIDTITKDIVYFTEIGKRSKRTEYVNTNKVIQDIFNYFNAKYKNVSLSSNDLPSLEINENLCYDLFSHLVENAIIHSDKKKKTVSINCKKDNEYYLFSIKDNGNGISPELIDAIFIMFKKLQNDMDSSGSGIGLSVCKKIISVYNGKIWTESIMGQGSTFYFTIPLEKEQKDKNLLEAV
jgi:signal transduction histidine kinase